MFKKILVCLGLLFLALPSLVLARQPSEITDWYIKDFDSEIVVNADSSVAITETIVADCGNLPDKHGIYRVLPEFYVMGDGQKVSTTVKLISIKDENGRAHAYSTNKSSFNKTVTWKIGDPNKTVTGENTYIIKYKVLNTIRFDNEDFDEFYWNLNGNYWDLEIDDFSAEIIFPAGINSDNSETYLYSGELGDKNTGLAEYSWIGNSTIQVDSTEKLEEGEGVTLSVSFPKGIINEPELSFWQEYGSFILSLLAFIIPLIIFGFCFNYWRDKGRNPNRNKTVIAHYDVPDKMPPMEFGNFWNNNTLKTKYISAAIVNLAVKGFIEIEEVAKKGIFGSKDTKLILVKQDFSDLPEPEKKLVESVFDGKAEIMISDLKNKFYKKLPAIRKMVKDKNKSDNLFDNKLMMAQKVFIVVGGLVLFGFALLIPFLEYRVALIVSFVCGVVIVLLGVFMNRRTQRGADLYWEAEGFKLYMETAEKHRQQFYEKENIFEKFLPYAMVFGMTKLWAKKMKEIYGEAYFNNYAPAWYVGSATAFDLDNFASQIDSISSSMASSMSSNPSSSGSGGGGFSGGGAGGGGGGGW